MKFLRKYKDHYKGYLTDNFEEASWRFMHRALAPSQMDEVFTAQLKHVPKADRSFTKVETIVWDIFRLSDLTGTVLQKLFTFKSDPNEGPGTFVFHVEALIQGAKAEEMQSRFINDAIYCALPAQGRMALKTKFPDFNTVEYSEVLAFISQAPNILSGEREQKDEWAIQKWAKHLLTTRAVTSQGKISRELSHQRPFKRTHTESETQSHGGSFTRVNHRAFGVTSAKVIPMTCTWEPCKTLPDTPGHSNADCIRHDKSKKQLREAQWQKYLKFKEEGPSKTSSRNQTSSKPHYKAASSRLPTIQSGQK